MNQNIISPQVIDLLNSVRELQVTQKQKNQQEATQLLSDAKPLIQNIEKEAWFKKGSFWVTKTIEDLPSFLLGL
jgi:hypothetical protein